jgi:hypothetical protein
MKWYYIVLVVIVLITTVLRFTLPIHGLNQEDIFKDFAHLFVGGLFGAAIVSRDKVVFSLASFLVAIELLAFFTRK